MNASRFLYILSTHEVISDTDGVRRVPKGVDRGSLLHSLDKRGPGVSCQPNKDALDAPHCRRKFKLSMAAERLLYIFIDIY